MRAEYDRTNNRVVAVENDEGRVWTTAKPRVLGADTEWLPMVQRYPDDFNPRFSYLLHEETVRYTYDPDQNIVLVEYPDADFSADALRAQLVDQVKRMAARELQSTDWYITRKAETGASIPDDVLARRAEIRAKSDAYETALAGTADADLEHFTVTYGTEDHGPEPETADPLVESGDGTQWITNAHAPEERGEPVRRANRTERNPHGPAGTEKK